MKVDTKAARDFAEGGDTYTGAEVRLWVHNMADAIESLTAELAAIKANQRLKVPAEPVHFLADATRFKVKLLERDCRITNLPRELGGRWVALVAAEDDCHLKLAAAPAAPQAPAATQAQAAEPVAWISVEDRLPADETPVLAVVFGKPRIAELRWEKPGWEDTFTAHQYWDDPEDDGQDWQWSDVTHWMQLPAAPAPQAAEPTVDGWPLWSGMPPAAEKGDAK